MVSWVSEGNKQKTVMRERGGKRTKKESPVEVSEKAYLSSIPEASPKSKGCANILIVIIFFCFILVQ
jgi:hypothetical protein